MRGDIYMARKMFREAIDKFRECPPSAQVENKIGIAFHQLLQLDLAKRSYEASIKMDPKFPQPINNLGTVYYCRRNYGKSMKYYRKALKLDPDSASIWVNLGSSYFAKHDLKHAAQAYNKAMELDPMIFEHRSQYGTLLQERTVEDRAKFHLYLAKAYAQRGDKEHALMYLRKALEEGIKERKKIPEMPEFASIKTDPNFKDLLLQDPKPL
jgi:tetratricopeptide (TPR) repeat protein